MRPIKKVLGLLYSAYVILVYFILLIPTAIFYSIIPFFKKSQQVHLVYFANRNFIFTWSALTFFRYKTINLKKVDRSKSYILVINHINAVDMVAAAYGQRIKAKPLVKKELTKIPLLGWLFKIGAIPVVREDKDSRGKSIQTMLDQLENGVSIVIFPEGTRNLTQNPLIPFHNGAFKIAFETNHPILPVVFTHHRLINKPKTLELKPGKTLIHYLEPLYPKNYPDIESMKKACYDIMYNYILRNDPVFVN
jgi:1-acyl-sn-glycerol-3-phosphate acyltransferase